MRRVENPNDVDEFSDLKFGIIPDKCIRCIAETREIWIKELNDFMEYEFIKRNEQLLWKSFKKVINYLYYYSKDMDCNFDEISLEFKNFGEAYIFEYPGSRPNYIHILVCHAVDIMKRIPFSSKGIQSVNRSN